MTYVCNRSPKRARSSTLHEAFNDWTQDDIDFIWLNIVWKADNWRKLFNNPKIC